MPIAKSWRDRPAHTLAALGFLSGVLSAIVGFEVRVEALDGPAQFFFLSAEMMPVGMFFAAVIAFGIAAWGKPPWAPVVTFAVTLYAWSAAIQTALWMHRLGGGDASHTGPLLAGFFAGLVGAALTHLAAAIFAPGLRDASYAMKTCVTGAVAGLLFYLGSRNIIDSRILFVVWQPAVAYCIGIGLAARAQARPA